MDSKQLITIVWTLGCLGVSICAYIFVYIALDESSYIAALMFVLAGLFATISGILQLRHYVEFRRNIDR